MSIDVPGNGSLYPSALLSASEAGRSGPPANANDDHLQDDSMERVRELIVGDLRRGWDARLHAMEARLQSIEQKLEALRLEAASVREEQMAGLAQGVEELGQFIRRMKRP